MADQEADHCEFDQPLHYSYGFCGVGIVSFFFFLLGPVVYDIANNSKWP